MTRAATKLEPCPFCGSDEVFADSRRVECEVCGALGPRTQAPAALSVKSEAIAAWNRRKPA